MDEPVKQYKQLGWANSWYMSRMAEHSEANDILTKCRELKHPIKDKDIGPPNRGIDHLVTCEICSYQYHYDSSD
jgi:hypothetical protein